MRDTDQLSKRLAIIQLIAKHPGDIGKTKIQKIVYFLQESLSVSLGYRFRMHHYGPYSDQLDGILSLSKSLGFVDIEPDDDGWGFRVTPLEAEGRELLERFDVTQLSNFEALERTIEDLGYLDTPKLELRATIHFVGGPESNKLIDETVATVKHLKPRFSEAEIKSAYEELKEESLI